jgi:hypothetical protein
MAGKDLNSRFKMAEPVADGCAPRIRTKGESEPSTIWPNSGARNTGNTVEVRRKPAAEGRFPAALGAAEVSAPGGHFNGFRAEAGGGAG